MFFVFFFFFLRHVRPFNQFPYWFLRFKSMVLIWYELVVFKSIVLHSCFHMNFGFDVWKSKNKQAKRIKITCKKYKWRNRPKYKCLFHMCPYHAPLFLTLPFLFFFTRSNPIHCVRLGRIVRSCTPLTKSKTMKTSS